MEQDNATHVLIVEDEPDMASMLKMLLERKFSATVEIAEDCTSAREKFSSGTFDIITLDYQLPDGDGLELLGETQAMETPPPVIMVTGHGDEQTAVKSFKHGAIGYVVKDKRLSTLLPDAVEHALSEAELKHAEQRIEHLNLVLSTIRNVNQLIVREKDRERMLTGACEILTETRGYHNVWIALLDESGKLDTYAESGLGESFAPMVEMLQRGELTSCGQRAIEQDTVVANLDPPSDCPDCPLSGSYRGRAAMTSRLEHEGRVFGLMSASIPAHFATDAEEQGLFSEVAGDIGLALRLLEAEEEREELLRHLGERVKELDCLYGLSAIIERPGISLEEIFKEAVELIPPSWRYPDITCAKLAIGDKEFTTDNYRDTEWRQSADITIDGEREGTLEVCYLEKMPDSYEGPFLAEERNLIDALAERLGRNTERKRTEEVLRTKNSAVESAISAIALADLEGILTYVNDAFLAMWGYDDEEEVLGKPAIEFHVDEDEAKRAIESLLEKRILTAELASRRKDGSTFTAQVSANMITDESGNPKLMMGSFIDITERKRTEEELAKINAELEGYAHTVSHDLKGSLAGIMLGVDMLADSLEGVDTGDAGETSEIVSLIARSAGNAQGLIEDLLALAESGQMPRETSPVDVREVVEEVLGERSHEIEEKGIEVDVSGDLGTITASPMQIRQVFSNLMSNAIKHAHSESPVIEISYLGDGEDGGHRYLVRDNGPGIPEDIIDKVFIPFTRGEGGETGIGLSIVEKLAKVYGGEIRAYNDNGACFEFTLRDF